MLTYEGAKRLSSLAVGNQTIIIKVKSVPSSLVKTIICNLSIWCVEYFTVLTPTLTMTPIPLNPQANLLQAQVQYSRYGTVRYILYQYRHMCTVL
jgi:hypothetical protein